MKNCSLFISRVSPQLIVQISRSIPLSTWLFWKKGTALAPGKRNWSEGFAALQRASNIFRSDSSVGSYDTANPFDIRVSRNSRQTVISYNNNFLYYCVLSSPALRLSPASIRRAFRQTSPLVCDVGFKITFIFILIIIIIDSYRQ